MAVLEISARQFRDRQKSIFEIADTVINLSSQNDSIGIAVYVFPLHSRRRLGMESFYCQIRSD